MLTLRFGWNCTIKNTIFDISGLAQGIVLKRLGLTLGLYCIFLFLFINFFFWFLTLSLIFTYLMTGTTTLPRIKLRALISKST